MCWGCRVLWSCLQPPDAKEGVAVPALAVMRPNLCMWSMSQEGCHILRQAVSRALPVRAALHAVGRGSEGPRQRPGQGLLQCSPHPAGEAPAHQGVTGSRSCSSSSSCTVHAACNMPCTAAPGTNLTPLRKFLLTLSWLTRQPAMLLSFSMYKLKPLHCRHSITHTRSWRGAGHQMTACWRVSSGLTPC